jgi:aminoacrylate hydrolase
MPLISARDGCRLFASMEGDGEPVFLIPGLGGSAMFFAQIALLLAKRFTVIQMDHRGTGRSERPLQDYTIELMARDAVDVLDHFGIAAAHIVGHSTGGVIAQEMALDHAARIKSIVPSGSWAKPDPQFTLLFETRLAILKDAGPKAYAATGLFLACPPGWIRDNIAEVKAAIEKADEDFTPVDVVAERIRMILRFDRSADLARVKAPTLCIAARDDAIIPFHMSETLMRAIPGAQLTAVEGGHFFPRVDPKGFSDIVTRFIATRS